MNASSISITALFRSLIVAMGVALLLSAAQAQTTHLPNAGPFRDTPDATDAKLMLLGHDAVAYFTQNAAVKGKLAIKTEHLGMTYRFATETNRAEFLRSPGQYMPQFGGFCANGINYVVPWGAGGGPET